MKHPLTIAVILFTLFLWAITAAANAYDACVSIHQNTLNSFLKAIGTISNKGKTNVLGMDIGYTWFVKNPRISIDEEQSLFISDVAVDMGIFKYDTEARGKVLVNYDNLSNRIKIDIKKVTFELYVNLFGNKIHITDVDISGFYHPQFEFAGPEPMQSNFELKLPDGTPKHIYVKNAQNTIHLEKEQIIVESNLIFDDKPFPSGNVQSLPTGNNSTSPN